MTSRSAPALARVAAVWGVVIPPPTTTPTGNSKPPAQTLYAKLKLDFTHDHLAGKEMEIGRYYLNKGEYLAAMNRFKRVIDNYQTTTHVPEALERLVECDLALGLINEAKQNAAVLGYNYPGSHWYENAYALVGGNLAPGQPQKGWFGSLVGNVF